MKKDRPEKFSLSVFFPAYNEAENIVGLLKEVLKVVPKIAADYEIIVVNDGSKDETAQIVKNFSAKFPRVRLVNHLRNRGYGAAVWSGLQAAKKEVVFFCDSDRQFHLRELPRFLSQIKNYDVVIGYRNPRRDSFIRILNAKGWKFLLFLLFGLKVRDVDCAFKAFRRSVLKDLNVKSRGAMFSAELLIELKRKGYNIYEQPVSHYPRQAGSPTGAKLSVISRAFSELWRVYLSREDLVRSRSLFVYFLAVILLFLSRLLFLSHSYDFFDSTQYGSRATLGSYIDVMTSGHPPFHPLYNLFSAAFYKLPFAHNPVIATSLPSAILGSLSIIFVFLLLRKLFDNRVAWLASIFYALSSFVWISQITVLVDPTEHLFYFLSLYLLACALDKNNVNPSRPRPESYLLFLAAGISFGLAGFAHTQVALWSLGVFTVVIIVNKNWDRESLKKILLKLLLFLAGAGLFVLAYLPLFIYAAQHRTDVTDITVSLGSYRSALKYLLLGNAGDHTTIIKSNYIRYILTLGTVLGSATAFCGFIKLVKNEWKKALAILIWFLPSSVVASTYIYENLYGRALIIALVPLFALAAYFVLGLKFKWKILLGGLIIAQICVISIPAVLKYKKLPAANESLAKMQQESAPDGVFVSSNVTRTWANYHGKFVNFGDVGTGAAEAEKAIDQALDAGKPAFVSSDAIFLPFRRYDGEYFDLRSVNVGDATSHGTILSNLFDKYDFTLVQSSNIFKQFVYSLSRGGEDWEKTFSLARDSKIIVGRIVDKGRGVPAVNINSFVPACGVEEEDITRRDGLFCLERMILGKKRPENWTYSDADGWFYLPTKSDHPQITLGLLAADLKSNDPKLKFVEERSVSLTDAKYLGNFDQTGLLQFAKNQARLPTTGTVGQGKSFYGISKFENNKVSFDVYTFDFSLPLTNKIEAENLSGPIGKIKKDKSASGGFVRSANNEGGYLVSGPYLDLGQGRYRVEFAIRSIKKSDDKITLDVVSHNASISHAKDEVSLNEYFGKDFKRVGLDFTLDKEADGVEFRLTVSPGAPVELDFIELSM